eukprot:Rhum_TRINITY_DN9221_c0_g1::Rhum_TRINITY_DN9221_c0_g1_i1::g.32328::m.32328
MALSADRLKGRVCVVTGAASGIGRGIALVLAEHGARVALVDVSDLTETVAEVTAVAKSSPEDNVLACRCDITSPGDLECMVREVMARWRRQIHVVVNNACRFVFHDVLTATPEDWDASLAVNVKGHALVLRHVVPYMVTDGTGSIVNISSISASIAQPNLATYAVTKAAILQLTRNTALDLGVKHKIRVNAVCPGAIFTPATLAHFEGDKKKNPEKNLQFDPWVRKMNGGILDRLGTTREVGMAVLFLASDESSYCTGSALMVDGGWGAHPVSSL